MKQLVAYITAGFPSVEFSVDLALSLQENGVDTLELGIPFSDPVADGPVIEAANLQALKNGFKMDDLFDISSRIATKVDTLWMGYFNPFYHKGMDFYIGQARHAGVSGFIIPDLPFEEAGRYKGLVEGAGLSLISFVAPTHSRERIKLVASDSQKFIYLVAYAGITGSGVAEELAPTIQTIRSVSDTPIYVGFGVDEKTAKEKAKNVDGVIVGSAFVKVLLDESLTGNQKISKISSLARTIKDAINE